MTQQLHSRTWSKERDGEQIVYPNICFLDTSNSSEEPFGAQWGRTNVRYKVSEVKAC